MQTITTKKVRLRILGHDVCLSITSASAPIAEEWLNPLTIDVSELGSIQFDLCMNRLCGEFEAVSYRLYSTQDREPLQYAGFWQVIPDYRQFMRIFQWWYNVSIRKSALRQEINS